MHEYQQGEFTISTDPARLDVDVIHGFLSKSYWAQGRSRETVVKSLENSLCFGVYKGNQQVGLARVITDYATFAYVCDVFILEDYQGQGLGKWLMKTGWWPDYQPRLFKKGSVSWQVGVHRLPDIQGQTEHFPAEEAFALVHYNYNDVTQFLEKLNIYTTLQAKERLAISPQDNFSAQQFLEIFASEFAKRALAMDGVEDGLHGLSLSLLQAMYESSVYLKQWGEKGFQPTTPENLGAILNKMQKIWRYWWADYQVRHTNGINQFYWRIRRKLTI